MATKMYRAGVVGAMRGLFHATSYRGIDNMRVVALCEIDEDRLAKGVERLGVHGYRSYEEMLAREELDVVHIVNRPSLPRAQWIRPAVAAGVRVMVLEKPIARTPEELEHLCRIVAGTGLKVVVNTQRRYWLFSEAYQRLRHEGRLVEPHFVRGSTVGGVIGMGTHLIDLILFVLGDTMPTAVWAAAEGAAGFENPDELSPTDLIAQFTFPTGARAFMEVTAEPHGSANFPPRQKLHAGQADQCNFDLWASDGVFWYRQCGTWGYHLHGTKEPVIENTDFTRDDPAAQTRFTAAIGQWLDDENRPHRNRLEIARLGMDCLFGALRSALEGRRLKFPIPVADQDMRDLKKKCSVYNG